MAGERTYEIVLLGATGYTGKLTAEHIAQHLPTNLKWAIAGRSEDRLQKLAANLKEIASNRLQPETEVVQLHREDIDNLVKKSKVCISTVGPYSWYGEIVIEACISNQTNYIDVSGDIPWLKEMYEKYESSAKENGTLLVSSCGNFTAPQDLLTLALVTELRKKTSSKTKEVILSVCEMTAQPSGGSLLSVFESFEKNSAKTRKEAGGPWYLSPIQGQGTSNSANMFGIRRDPNLGLLSASSISAEQNRPIIHRSWGLLQDESEYGQNFQYNEYIKATWPTILGNLSNTFLLSILSIAPLRKLAKMLVFSPGEGPDPEETKKTRIELQAVAIADQDGEEPARAIGKLVYSGGPYHISALYLAQGAATLLYDQGLVKSIGGGFITPAILGQALIDRAEMDGAHIETKVLK